MEIFNSYMSVALEGLPVLDFPERSDRSYTTGSLGGAPEPSPQTAEPTFEPTQEPTEWFNPEPSDEPTYEQTFESPAPQEPPVQETPVTSGPPDDEEKE